MRGKFTFVKFGESLFSSLGLWYELQRDSLNIITLCKGIYVIKHHIVLHEFIEFICQ